MRWDHFSHPCVAGFPNVGKSSLINSLKRARACNVGATPGVTKWVYSKMSTLKHLLTHRAEFIPFWCISGAFKRCIWTNTLSFWIALASSWQLQRRTQQWFFVTVWKLNSLWILFHLLKPFSDAATRRRSVAICHVWYAVCLLNLRTVMLVFVLDAQIMEHYGVQDFHTALEFLALLAQRQGKLRKGGLPDTDKAAKSVLMDWTGLVKMWIEK